MCAVLSSRHFAPRRVGRLEVRRGFESAAAAIFESQLHGYRGADESDDMEGDVEDTLRAKGGGDEHSVSIVPALEVVADGGFKWAEGPLWVLRPGHEGDASYGRLLFFSGDG